MGSVIIFTLVWAVVCVIGVWTFVVTQTGIGLPERKPREEKKKKFRL